MSLGDLLKCARPIIFEDNLEGYEYSGSGTFFFARYSGRFYGITAKHCLRDRDKDSIRLLLIDAPKGAELVPIRTLHTIEDPPEGMEDWADLAFMELRDESLTEAQKKAPWFVDFDVLIRMGVSMRPGDVLVTRGCPSCIFRIDYEALKILTGFFSVDGTYAGRGIDKNTHVFKFSDLSQIENPNGMSGSPVFKIKETEHGVDYWFAGVILRSTKASGIAFFVDWSVVFQALQMLKNG